MAQSVSEFFEGLPGQVDESKTAGLTNTYRFDIDGAGSWTVDVQDGKVSVAQDGDAEPDCTISTSEEIFQKLIDGEQNPTTAYMTGKLKIQGDMGAAMKLQKLF
jgi:putative sterol carrier protein